MSEEKKTANPSGFREAPKPQAAQDIEHTIGGGYIKPNTVRRAVVAPIDGRPVSQGAPLGPSIGQYGVDIPVHISGVPYVVTVGLKTGDYRDLYTAFGAALDAWVGCTIEISSDPTLNRIRVAAVS